MPIRLLRLIKRKLGLGTPGHPAEPPKASFSAPAPAAKRDAGVARPASGASRKPGGKPGARQASRSDVTFERHAPPRSRGDEWQPQHRPHPRRAEQPAPSEPAADGVVPPKPQPRVHKPQPRVHKPEPVETTPWDPATFDVPPTEGRKRFHDFDLPSEIMRAIQELGFRYCTPIQAETLGLTMAGRNVAGRAQTGTGKTAAFLITILRRMLHDPASRPAQPGRPAALVIGPTRELVIQIAHDAEMLGKYCGLRCVAVYGGMDYAKQQDEIAAGPVDLMVATPGRLLDFKNSRVVDLKGVHTLVIDEADRMLDMGFIPDVRKIINSLPERDKRQTLLFSATLTDDVMRLASQWMPDPVQVAVEPENATVSTITQLVYPIAAREKFTVLYNLLQREKAERVLVFCNRRIGCERLMNHLLDYGIPCEMLSGDVAQKKRLRVLEDFRSGKIKVVVATDVAGRGIHVDDIAYVVNFDFPYEADDYIHRIGRTGRAGNIGTAISFACEDESFIIPDIETLLGKALPCQSPPDELLAELPKPQHRHRHEIPAEDRATRHDDRRGGHGGRGGPRRSGPPRGGRR